MPAFEAQITGPDLDSAADKLKSAGVQVHEDGDPSRTEGAEGAPANSGSLAVTIEAEDPEEARNRVTDALGDGYSTQVSSAKS